jgi:hypothetical protein
MFLYEDYIYVSIRQHTSALRAYVSIRRHTSYSCIRALDMSLYEDYVCGCVGVWVCACVRVYV